jgi:biopolymer transport protein ExbD
MGGRLDHGEDSLAEMHEINVTPFIDVMLVLLIIFMVAAPLATGHSDQPSDLDGRVAAAAPHTATPDGEGRSHPGAGDDAVERKGLGAALDGATGGDSDTRIFLCADRTVSYGKVMQVMNLLRAAGYLKVALVGLAP